MKVLELFILRPDWWREQGFRKAARLRQEAIQTRVDKLLHDYRGMKDEWAKQRETKADPDKNNPV